MTITPKPRQIKRSFPEAREFLSTNIVGADYPVKHLIEQARNKGHITRGKAGRGGGVVTSQDMAMLLTGTLAGDTPQSATDAMSRLVELSPSTNETVADEHSVRNRHDDWWNEPFVDVIANFIDAWRQNKPFDFEDMTFSVNRSPIFFASIVWNEIPEDRDLHVNYSNRDSENLITAGNQRIICVSMDGETLMLVADWLEGREGHG